MFTEIALATSWLRMILLIFMGRFFTSVGDRFDRGLWFLEGLPWLAMAALHSDELFNEHIDWMAEVFQIYEDAMALENISEGFNI